MRVVLTSAPAASRITPLFPLFRALKRAGHDVRFIISPSFSQLFSDAEFSCCEMIFPEIEELREEARRRWSHWDAWRPDQRASSLFAVVLPFLVVDHIKAFLLDWDADLLIHEECEFSGPLAAALSRRPSVCLGWPGPRRTDSNIAALASMLDQLWISAGLSHIGMEKRLYGECLICTCPSSLELKAKPNGLRCITMRPDYALPTDSAPSSTSCPDLVHATLGTVPDYNSNTEILDQIAKGMETVGLPLVISTGATVDPARWHSLSTRIYAESYIPHEEILSFCSVTICHGGVSTFIRALAHGCPLIILPQGGASQARNAEACVRRGVGLALRHDQVSTDSIGEAVRLVVESAHYRMTAREVAKEIEAMPAPDSVVRELEALSRTR